MGRLSPQCTYDGRGTREEVAGPVRAIWGTSADDVFAVGGESVGRVFRRVQGTWIEQTIPRAYLKKLEVLYEEWFAAYDLSPTLVIETDRVDYIEHLFDRLEVAEAIRRHIAPEGNGAAGAAISGYSLSTYSVPASSARGVIR